MSKLAEIVTLTSYAPLGTVRILYGMSPRLALRNAIQSSPKSLAQSLKYATSIFRVPFGQAIGKTRAVGAGDGGRVVGNGEGLNV